MACEQALHATTTPDWNPSSFRFHIPRRSPIPDPSTMHAEVFLCDELPLSRRVSTKSWYAPGPPTIGEVVRKGAGLLPNVAIGIRVHRRASESSYDRPSVRYPVPPTRNSQPRPSTLSKSPRVRSTRRPLDPPASVMRSICRTVRAHTPGTCDDGEPS